MSTTTRILRNWKSGAWGAALTVVFGLFQPLAPKLAELSYHLPFHLRPEIKRDEAVIIYMDDQSHDDLNQNRTGTWDRSLHAALIKRLIEYRPKAIVFDVLFDQETTNDVALLNAIRTAGIPILVGATINKIPGALAKRTEYKVPFDELAAVAHWGWAERGSEGEMLRKHFPTTMDQRGDPVPSLAWRTAELTSTNKPPDGARRWINYYGPQGILASYSYSRVLSNDVAASAFAGKVCFVGAFPPRVPSPVGGFIVDRWPTPYGPTPGVDIIATVYLNLLHHEWLQQLPVLGEVLLVLAAGLLFGWGLTLVHPLKATVISVSGILIIIAAACWIMFAQLVWFSWMIIVAVQIPVALGWSILSHTRQLAEEKAALQTQLVAAQTAMQEMATTPPEGTATRVEGAKWSGRADTAAEKAFAVISRSPRDGQFTVPDHDLVRRVGKGAYGEVWLARNLIGTYHAVKIVKREDFQSEEPFEREFRGIQKFMPISRSHPGLVQILHVGRNQEQGYMYYIMELADDETTGQEIHPEAYVPKNLAKEIKKRRHLPVTECLQLSLDLTAALEFLHQQHLIHRDIKPANIIFVKAAPKFADIGLVTDIAPTGRETTFLGTLGYIAPEGPGTPAADVFSLGKVLYEASMGLNVQQYPELPSTMMQRPDPESLFKLNQIILKACQEDRKERYHSAAEMHDELLKLQIAIAHK